MKQHHNWTITEYDSLIPWERDIYITMLEQSIKEEKQRLKMREQQRNG